MDREAAEWISAREAGRRLTVVYHCVPRIAEVNGIRRRVIPGTQTKYFGPDVDALAAVMVQGKGVETRRAAS